MILILSDAYDTHADFVTKKLDIERLKYYRFNLDVESLKRTIISYRGSSWKINDGKIEVDSKDFSCVWCRRPFMELTLEEQNYTGVDFRIWKNEWNKTLLGLYNSIKELPWLNPLRKAYKGENKYYQMELANAIGLDMPDTLISNNKKELVSFVKKYDKVLMKLMSQEIYDLGENDFRGFYTNVITEKDLEKFGELEENPIVLQPYIEKEYEVRYTIVGDRHFACKIDSQKSERAKYDWRRYDIPNTPHSAIEPPKSIRNKVSKMLTVLGIEYGAFDFIVTPDDEWIFLEVNCMGQWLWIEQLANLPISDAIVDWLKIHN